MAKAGPSPWGEGDLLPTLGLALMVYAAGLAAGGMSRGLPFPALALALAAWGCAVWTTTGSQDGGTTTLGAFLRVAGGLHAWNVAELTVVPGRRLEAHTSGILDSPWLRLFQAVSLQDLVQAVACVAGLIVSYRVLLMGWGRPAEWVAQGAHPFEYCWPGDVVRWVLSAALLFSGAHLLDVAQRVAFMCWDMNLPAMSPDPYSAITLAEFWSSRWMYRVQLLLKSAVYKPGRRLGLPEAPMVLATFAVSGAVNGGLLALAFPRAPLRAATWLGAYFAVQGVLVVLEKGLMGLAASLKGVKTAQLAMGLDPILMRVWTMAAVLGPAPLALDALLMMIPG